MRANTSLSNKGSWISLLIGGPIGIVVIILFITELLYITREGLIGLALFYVYKNATIALALMLLPSLWFTGRLAELSLRKGNNLIYTSAKYSIFTNLCIWIVFTIVYSVQHFDLILGLVIPIILFFLSALISTFTVGLIICYIIKRKLPAHNNG